MLGLCHLNSLSKKISTHHNRHLPALITRLSSSESWALNNSNINHVGQSNPGHYSSSAAPEAMNKQNRDGQSPDSSAATQGMNGQNRDEDVYLGARVPMKGWQRAAVAIGSALGALMNPARADLVAALGETTGTLAFDNILKRMRLNPEGRRILSERPRVTSVAVGHAWELPPNTFGAAYAKFMGSRNFSPDDRPPVRFMNSEELAYVATRAREIHDFWHVLFDLPTNVIGESALKIVEFQQTFLPMCFLSVVGGSIRLKPEKRDLLVRHYLPWALKAGMNSNDLMCIYYEKYLHEDLEQVRQMWGIIAAPSLPRNKFTQ